MIESGMKMINTLFSCCGWGMGDGGGGGDCGNTKGGPNLSLAIPYIPGSSFPFFLASSL